MKVLKFGAVWCSGCIVMKPIWEEIENELSWLETEYYDYDENPEAVTKYNIGDEIPVFIFLDKEGNEFHRMEGQMSKKELTEFLQANKDR